MRDSDYVLSQHSFTSGYGHRLHVLLGTGQNTHYTVLAEVFV